ncbi:hypothetical protein AAFN47_23415 [Hoeflea sp. CAU 1731]
MYGNDAALKLTDAWSRLTTAYMSLALASQEVVWRRSIKLANGSLTPVEFTRMFFEKPSAFAKAAERVATAAAARKGPVYVAEALVGPIGAEAKRNARRLRRN